MVGTQLTAELHESLVLITRPASQLFEYRINITLQGIYGFVYLLPKTQLVEFKLPLESLQLAAETFIIVIIIPLEVIPFSFFLIQDLTKPPDPLDSLQRAIDIHLKFFHQKYLLLQNINVALVKLRSFVLIEFVNILIAKHLNVN
jgi:hypothetical protein